RSLVEHGAKWTKVRFTREDGTHRQSGCIEFVHWWHAKQFLDGPDHAGLVVVNRIDPVPFHKRADDQTHRAVPINVIDSILRVVFGNEDRGSRPIAGVRYRLDDFAESKIIVGEHRSWTWIAVHESGGVIVGEKDDDQIR